MKYILFTVLLFAPFNFMAPSNGITEEERAFAVSELTRTKNMVQKTIENLSMEQLNFKSTPETWSIAECVEHLAISENSFSEMLQGALQTPADASKRDQVKLSDEALLEIITDRSNKVKTPEPFEPSGKFGSHEETLQAFHSKRAEHITYVENTDDDLRNHYGQLPFGTIDGLQILLFMSGHTERHVKQMQEVMASSGFPME
ncbi:DinB family protein [Sediminicola sp. 1XM1-17]|uniref:DinB family protein n=1 Tax=Sediminicola sp. 1XM1-17 TaxID=3127702 RepID=UPI003076BB9F